MKKLISEYGEAVKTMIVAGGLLGIVCHVVFGNGIVRMLSAYVSQLYG